MVEHYGEFVRDNLINTLGRTYFIGLFIIVGACLAVLALKFYLNDRELGDVKVLFLGAVSVALLATAALGVPAAKQQCRNEWNQETRARQGYSAYYEHQCQNLVHCLPFSESAC